MVIFGRIQAQFFITTFPKPFTYKIDVKLFSITIFWNEKYSGIVFLKEFRNVEIRKILDSIPVKNCHFRIFTKLKIKNRDVWTCTDGIDSL